MAKQRKKTASGGAAERTILDILSIVYEDLKKKIPQNIERFKVSARIKFEEARKEILGETIVVLGPPAAGKSTLLKVLRDRDVLGKDLQTYTPTELNAAGDFKCSWNLDVGAGRPIKFKFKVRKTSDLGGEAFIRENHWGNAIKDAKILIYMFDLKRLNLEGEYRKRILEDFDWLLINSQKPKPDFSLLLVANKVDLLCTRENFETFEESQRKELEKLLSQIRSSWKPGLRSRIKDATILSLTDDILRHLTFDNLILGFIGENLRELYKKSAQAEL